MLLRSYIEEKKLFDQRYLMMQRIGGGVSSDVIKARDTISNTDVVLKVSVADSSDAEMLKEAIESHRREFQLSSELNHSNILRPFLFSLFRSVPYLVLPYCPHGNVYHYMKTHEEVSEAICWKIIHDVASGLAYLHAKPLPIIHQDIKPDNILIDADGHFLITDFDVSAVVQTNRTKELPAHGTLAYMAPERYDKSAVPIMANDVWSLGAMMYEVMNFGTLPFGEMGGLLQKSGERIPEFPNKYSKSLCRLVASCMSLHPWNRPIASDIEEYAYDKMREEPDRPSNPLYDSIGAPVICRDIRSSIKNYKI